MENKWEDAEVEINYLKNNNNNPALSNIYNFYLTLFKYQKNEIKTALKDNRVLKEVYESPKTEKYILNVVVWGESYLENFLNYFLPSFFAEGNADELLKNTESIFVIHTTSSTRNFLKKSKKFKAFSKKFNFEFFVFPDALTLGEGYCRSPFFTTLNLFTIHLAQQRNAGVVFLAADIILSTQYFRLLAQIRNNDKHAIFCVHPRLDSAKLQATLHSPSHRINDTLAITSIELGHLAKKTTNPVLNNNFVTNETVGTTWPYQLYWDKGVDGFVIHGFHHHPLLFSPSLLKKYNGNFFFSNDSNFLSFIEDIDPTFSNCYVIPDDSIGLSVELTEEGEAAIPVDILTTREIAIWGETQLELHRWLFEQRVTLGHKKTASENSLFEDEDNFVKEVVSEMKNIRKQHGRRPYIAGVAPDMSDLYPQDF